MILTATGVAARLDGVEVLRGASLRLEPGKFAGIVGPNGAGKSTFLRTLHGALRPAAGEVRIDGRDVAAARPGWIARRVGVVPQSAVPRFPYRVADYVGLGRFPFTDGDADPDVAPSGTAAEIVARAMSDAGVEDLADRTVDRLSGGEFRRVLLAQVLAQEPRFLLLDEPLQQLDLRHQIALMDFVAAFVRRPGRSAVAVLHDLGMAARYCDEVLVLDGGSVHAAGAPRDVLTTATLRDVWGVDAAVGECPATGLLQIVPLRPTAVPAARKRDGTGGSGGNEVPPRSEVGADHVGA